MFHQVRAGLERQARNCAGASRADSIRRECENSLTRLKVETIDLYQIHWPEPDEDIEEGGGALARLKEEGKVRWIGVSNFKRGALERCRGLPGDVAAAALFGDFPEVETRFCRTARSTDGAIVYSPMKSGC